MRLFFRGTSDPNLNLLQRWWNGRSVGQAVLVTGTVSVLDQTVTAKSCVVVTNISGNTGKTYAVTLTPGKGFTITSSNGADTDTVAYFKEESD
jgi:hypothetical protein